VSAPTKSGVLAELDRLRRIEELARAVIFDTYGDARDWPIGRTEAELDALENLKRALRGET
jgi:hypothetical protein